MKQHPLATKKRRLTVSSYLVFFLVALSVLGPALAPGYLFLLDMVWPADWLMAAMLEDGVRPQSVLHAALTGLDWAVPSWFLQKMVLITVLAGAGASTYKLAGQLGWRRTAATLSGVMAMLNPYVAERFLAGHWLVLAGYAWLPFLLFLLLRWLQLPARRSYFLAFCLAYAVFPLLSVHWWYIATVLLLPIFALHYWLVGRGTRPSWRAIIGLLATFSIVNIWWLPFVAGSSGLVRQVGVRDFETFQTVADAQHGLVLNVLSQYGLWFDHFLLPKHLASWWPVYGIGSLLLALVGAWRYLAAKPKSPPGRSLAFAFTATLPVVILLGLGYSHDWGRAVIEVARLLPGFDGLRETGKVVGLLSLFVALFAPYTLSRLAHARWWLAAAGMVLVLTMRGMLWGAHGQLQAYQYPDSYKDASEVVSQLKGPILLLPWKGYLAIDFAGGAYAANPGARFFDAQVVSAELTGNNKLDTPDSLDKLILRSNSPQWAEDMRSDGYRYVILLKTDSWANYRQALQNSKVLFDSPEIMVVEL